MISAKVIADSVSPEGHRLTTIQATMHRFVLAEFNTHRVFSRNSASSRAIPVEKQLARVTESPAFPLAWPSEQPGMQGGEPLGGDDLADAFDLFEEAHEHTTGLVERYLERHPEKASRIHKSLVNRLLEPFMWHTVVVTATEWDGFWHQRVSPLAQPEIRVAAEAMLEVYEASTPAQIGPDRWHLPYVGVPEREWAMDKAPSGPDYWMLLKQISTARCARTSYLTQEGNRDPEEDIRLHDRLVGADPMHASPMEHVATPARPGQVTYGNFVGWRQYRHYVEGFYGHGLDDGDRMENPHVVGGQG